MTTHSLRSACSEEVMPVISSWSMRFQPCFKTYGCIPFWVFRVHGLKVAMLKDLLFCDHVARIAILEMQIPIGAEIVGKGADDLEEMSDEETAFPYQSGPEPESFKDYSALSLKIDHSNRHSNLQNAFLMHGIVGTRSGSTQMQSKAPDVNLHYVDTTSICCQAKCLKTTTALYVTAASPTQQRLICLVGPMQSARDTRPPGTPLLLQCTFSN